jgi:ribosomal protein L21E
LLGNLTYTIIVTMDDILEILTSKLSLKVLIPIAVVSLIIMGYLNSEQTKAGLRKEFNNVKIVSSQTVSKWWDLNSLVEINATDENGKPIQFYSGSTGNSLSSELLGKVGVCYDITATRNSKEESVYMIDKSSFTICNSNHK